MNLDNDPWTSLATNGGNKSPNLQQPSTLPLGGAAAGNGGGNGALDSMDIYSPQAQSQLKEFDELRSEIEDGGGAGAELNNNGTSVFNFQLYRYT